MAMDVMEYMQISGEYYNYRETLLPEKEYIHDYTSTLTMKMILSIPTVEGSTKVFLNFEQALEVIKMVDNLTRGIKKIVYLVGWQFNGHDDKYPAFDQVNEALKREQDQEAKDSLVWLMEEALKYHTTVSLHINMTDAYEDSPLWEEYIANNLIAKNEDGSLMAIGTWGANKTAYQIGYKNEWESGYAVKRINKLLEMLPIRKVGTIHIDAYICRQFANGSMEEERMYRRKVIRYFRSLGIDVTSEFLYNCPGRDVGQLSKAIAETQKDDLIGLVPMIWWFNQEEQDYIERPRSLVCGGRYNKDLNCRGNDDIAFLVGNSIHGEDEFREYAEGNEKWCENFMEKFCLEGIPWYYQNKFQLQEIRGTGIDRVAIYNDELKVILEGRKIVHHDVVLRDGNNLLMPTLWKDDEIIVYSKQGYESRKWELPKQFLKYNQVEIFQVTTEGLKRDERPIEEIEGDITLSILANQTLVLRFSRI